MHPIAPWLGLTMSCTSPILHTLDAGSFHRDLAVPRRALPMAVDLVNWFRPVHHGVDQGLYGFNEALHPVTRKILQRPAREWSDHVQGTSSRFQIGIHLLADHVDQLLLGVNEGIRSLAGKHQQFCLPHLLGWH